MALPKLNDVPKYELIIPSTGTKVRFRPYLVKEEKVLMVAAESGDANQIMNAMVDTVCACVDKPINRNDLTTFDLEYMFIQIRSKSVGETADLNLRCESCEEINKCTVNLEQIQCSTSSADRIIQLTDTVAVEMKYPGYTNINITQDESTLGFEILADCLKAVLTEDERIEIADEPKESVIEFLESMSKQQFEKVAGFLETIPQIKLDIEFDCTKCSHHNVITVRGMQGFF